MADEFHEQIETVQFLVDRYNASMTDSPVQHMQCMEVWGGSQLASSGVELGGLDLWVYRKPYGEAPRGGDVYYVSSCATGASAACSSPTFPVTGKLSHPRRPTFAR